MQQPFRRLAIVNRGEPAMRLIHAVRELNDERDDPIRLIALYTEPEREAMYVRHADEAVCIGPALVATEDGGRRSGYLDYPALERALVAARADAAWVGWGFVAEHPQFAELCERLGIVFVGPDAATMRLVGDKIEAKRLAEQAGVPVAPWSGGPVATAAEAIGHAERIGYPLMIKASAGGGGRGIRRVDAAPELAAAFEGARTESLQAFGEGTLLMERLVSPARHVEVQIIADGQGEAWAVGLRDCSYQRRNQKVIEESASPALSAEQEREVMEAARRLALRAGYRNAGTVEFLYEPGSERFSFMEVNARLQVEHPVTEMVTGLDLVKLQLHVAAGGRLEGAPPPPSGHAIEARLNAEDPALGFLPAPGRIALLRLPTGPGIRVDTGVSEGDTIPPEFDSMIAKLIAWGRDRGEALARLRRALAETMVVVDGGTTNQGFLLALLERPEVRSGDVDTGWLDRLHLRGEIVPDRYADVALVQAAIELAEAETATERARFYAFARRGRPQAAAAAAHTDVLRRQGHSYRIAVAQVGPGRHRVSLDGASVEAVVHRLGAHERRLQLGGRAYRTLTSLQGADMLVEVDGVPHRISRDEGGIVRNLAPAVVVSIPVEPGDEIEPGDVVAVVESMKMESSLTAPFRARVREVMVGANVHVAAQQPLLRLERIGGDAADHHAGGERVSLRSLAAGEAEGAGDLRHLEWLLLGYDADADAVDRIVAGLRREPPSIADEHRVLGVYADLQALTRPSRGADDPDDLLARSPREHLHAYLRSLDAEAEGLPPEFVEQLERALAHYGIHSLDRTPALEAACHRLFIAHERADAPRAAIVAILDRRLELAGELGDTVGDEFRELLDRLTAALGDRDPVLADLTREVRFRYFDQRVIDTARDGIYAEMERHADALAADPGSSAAELRIEALVASPWPLAPLLTARMRDAAPAVREALLETVTRRFYRVRTLQGFGTTMLAGQSFLTARYRHTGPPRRLATAYVEPAGLAAAVRAFVDWAATLPSDELAVGDFYLERPEDIPADDLAATIRSALAGIALPPALHRIFLGVVEPGRGRGISAMTMLTFRPGPDGLVEDEVLHGLHPMMSHRLHLWRLREFELDRLPAAEDVYLFHGVARSNAKDERLFAVAEVRDLTPVRDADGRVAALPELERVLVEALEGIRRFQAHRRPSKRLQWNRILLHVWPVIDLSPEDIQPLIARLAPATLGLGVEMLIVRGTVRDPSGRERDRILRFFTPTGHDVLMEIDLPPRRPLQPLDEGAQRVISARRRGLLHPAEIVKLLGGTFVEHELADDDRLVPVDRPAATNPTGVVVGLMSNRTDRHPDGMLRVILLGDPTRALGSLAEPECRRIMAALDLAQELRVPLEWFALSAGAKIAMDSGTENMDWIAAVLRRIIDFTQAGGEINIVVSGINVGAQPYWNAEATMLMHTKGILVMTPESAMVLTGKQALDYSGGVSAEDNFGIGGYERVMGPNGQAQYWAPDLAGACRLLLAWYERTYVVPGERFPRRADSDDPVDRDVRDAVHHAPGSDLRTVGDVVSDTANPGRKQPFDMRAVMRAVADADREPLERWPGMRDAEIAIVWDAFLGGWPVCMIGIESRPLPRHGMLPADGPEQWTSGTLFPRGSKKIARAINSASGRRPVVVLANLAGFDGSPESMREWQLEFGAEIGRAVVNFDGPIVFCVVSRYHGGAFVVFSQKLNEQLEAVALEGAHASVIGGAPAAAVVFARDVQQSAHRDERVLALERQIEAAEGAERQRLRAEHAELWETVLSECRGALAAQFDATHSVERAVQMGSVSGIVPPERMRPFLIDAVERGMRRPQEASFDGSGLAHALHR